MKRSSYQDVACTPEADEEYGVKTADDECNESRCAADDDTSDGKSCKEDKMAKLKKHPGAPKRFRTAFIIYSQHKHGELRAKLQEEGAEIDTINVARMVSDQWREMSAEEKERWEEMARQDKARYLKQKEEYAGPWKVPADMKKPKDPTAPKKPTPAYFSFSNERRQVVKKENPSASNGEISKILSKMWKDADDETRSIYIEKEKEERQLYNRAVEKWKQEKKDSGRENWWEHETATTDDEPGRDGGPGSKHKRSRLDVLADTAPQHEMIAAGQNRLDASEQGDLIGTTPIPASALSTMIGLSGPHSQSMQELSALSSQRGLQAIASLLPSLLGQGSQVSDSTIGNNSRSFPFATHFVPPAGNSHHSSGVQIIDALQQILTQQQPAPRGLATLQSLGEGGSLSLASLLGGVPSATSQNASGAASQSSNQANLLATLMGAAMSHQQSQQQQQQRQPSSIHQDLNTSALQGVNVHALLSILGGGTSSRMTTPHQQNNDNSFLTQLSLQDLRNLQQLSLLQQGLLQGNVLSASSLQGQGSTASSETRPMAAMSGSNANIVNNSTTAMSSSSSSLAALLGLHHLAGGNAQAASSQFLPFISQHQQTRPESTSSDQLRESLLQSWLQQQSGAGAGGSNSNGPTTATMSAAMMEEIIARLVRGRNQQ